MKPGEPKSVLKETLGRPVKGAGGRKNKPCIKEDDTFEHA